MRLENGRRRSYFLKIDFAKAYDTVDWRFLNLIMERFGFAGKWRAWIRECISSASVSVLVNGSPSGEFKLQRGLRQGDPPSSFLFLLAVEGLSILMKRAADCGFYEPAEIGSKKVKVIHLQFADDTVFLGTTKEENVWVMKRILRNMELLSGLKVNFDKSCLFGVNISESILHEMADILEFKVGKIPFSYLGIRGGIQYKKTVEWDGVVKKIKERLKRWEGNKISFCGRITLFNSILSVIPLYYLSFYKIPKKIFEIYYEYTKKFFVEGGKGSRKIS